MGKKLKKGKEGPATEYISRARAIKKLQVTLKDFRRLCILKGIYPREAPKRLKKTSKTYYHIKDINFLNHETILTRFREKRAHLRKIKRAIASGQKLKASKLKKVTPKYNMDHLVKERYPSFADALNDLDDPLSLVSLFASFPAHKEYKIPNEMVLNCQRLIKQFQVYVAHSHSLRKVFLSIKGIYYQASIQGSTVTWIQPYPIAPSMPLDVDYKVMSTFLEFYVVLLKFVNFKLLGKQLDFGVSPYIGTEFRKYAAEQAAEDQQFKIDEKFHDDEQVKQIQQKHLDDPNSTLFRNLVFLLSTEVPRASLEFVILSFGGSVVWSGDEQHLAESAITHVVTERTVADRQRNREYVQPQWVYDCINKLQLIPVRDYAPEKVLPPHLSPFDNQEEQNAVIDEEVLDSDQEDALDGPRVEAPVNKPKSAKAQKKLQLQSEKEKERMAQSTLTRKNKRLYDMIRTKELEKQEKLKQLQAKRKQIHQSE